MQIEYVPLLQTQRDLHAIPRSHGRFKHYLRTIFQQDELGMRVPLLAMNPMGKEHVTALLDQLLALNGDELGAQAAREASTELAEVPGDFKIALVVADDLMGGWTNRYADEFQYRFGGGRGGASGGSEIKLPRWLKHFWLFGILWSSEPASKRAVREAILTTAHRIAYLQQHGPARTLRDMIAQEGYVMATAGCTTPVLDAEDIAYTREVLVPFLDVEDNRTCIECLFGDAPGRTLGFTPPGLSPWAGLALALHDARLTWSAFSRDSINAPTNNLISSTVHPSSVILHPFTIDSSHAPWGPVGADDLPLRRHSPRGIAFQSVYAGQAK